MVSRSKKIDVFILFSFIAFFFFYLSHGLDTKDSGEFLVCAKRLLPAHSPGSVLYIIIGRLFVFMGAVGVNLLSLIFSVSSLFILLKLSKDNTLFKILIIILFSGSSIVYYSTSAEVYTAVLFFISLIVFFAEKRKYEALSFSSGLLALLSPIYFLLTLPFILIHLFKYKNKKNIIFIFILPIILYLFITIRLPYINNVFSSDSFIKTIDFISGKDFAVKKNVLSFDFGWITNNVVSLFLKSIKMSSFWFIVFVMFLCQIDLKKNVDVLITLLLYFVFFVLLRLDVKNVFHFFIPIIPLILRLFKDVRLEKSVLHKNIFISVALFFIVFSIFNIDVKHTRLPLMYAKDVVDIVKETSLVIVSIDNRINYFKYLNEYTDYIKKDIIFINLADLSKDYYLRSLNKELEIPEMIDTNPMVNLVNIIALNKNKKNIYFDADPSLYGVDISVYDHGLLFSTNVVSSLPLEIYNNIKEITAFNITLNDPEFKNLIISYRIALENLKNKIKDDEIKKRIDNWLSIYSY